LKQPEIVLRTPVATIEEHFLQGLQLGGGDGTLPRSFRTVTCWAFSRKKASTRRR
jgi:hypothetical protein